MDKAPLGGVWAAVCTPVDAALQPDRAKALAYYRELLAAGCDGVNVLGTTGEAMSWSALQRRSLMESLAAGGLPMDRAMVGCGAASLDDAVALTTTAVECRFAAVLIMPPFFFRDITDDGVVNYFDALLSRAKVRPKSVLLYNFPAMSGTTFHPELVERLVTEFPEAIAGLKDSSNDRALQAALLERHPALRIFPGSERNLADAASYGAAGCISGSVCLWPQLAHDVWTAREPTAARKLALRRDALDGFPFVAAVRHAIARLRHDDAWERAVPPLTALTAEQRAQLDARLLTDDGRLVATAERA